MTFPETLVDDVVAGKRRAIARAISLIEDEAEPVERVMRALYSHTGRAYVIGITGPPGAGKSTLVDELIRVIRAQSKTIAVLAVDPNSPFTGGAILGDRIRMMRHSEDDGVFIRSMGARGHLGGLSVAADNAVAVFDAAGMEIILLETVGVGQSELEVAQTADTTVVVIPPGLGDGVQAIKAGIMEIADIFVVNKADHPQTAKVVADIRDLLRMELAPREWSPPIVKTVAISNQGLEDLWTRIVQHRGHLERSGEFTERRKHRIEREVVSIASRRLRQRLIEPRIDTPEFQAMLLAVLARTMDPYEVAERILPNASTLVGR